jgi:putative membrane protein
MRNTSWFLVVVVIGTLTLSGCGRREAPPVPPTPPVIVPPPKPAPASAGDYFKLESSRSLLVVRASELAMQRSANGQILQIARRLKDDHNGIAAQLNMAGRRLNLLPSASLQTLDQMLLDGLSRASDFDVAYLRTMEATAENCARSHAMYAEKGTSPTLRPVARFAAAVCRDELGAL